MESYQTRTRLFVDVPALKAGAQLTMEGPQAHYLRSVLRAETGQHVVVFNGRDGAFVAEIQHLNKSNAVLLLGNQSAPQETLQNIALAFAPLKKERTAMLIEKATELGVAKLLPVRTARSQGQNVKAIKPDKLRAYIVEAAEQCGRTALAQLEEACTLERLLEGLGPEDTLLFADEMTAGTPAPWPDAPPPGWTTLLIGPEGGFSSAERAALHAHSQARPVTLGPRILRAETAALAALTLWQSKLGDWA